MIVQMKEVVKKTYKNDTLTINGDNEYRANIYQTHAPRYIPY